MAWTWQQAKETKNPPFKLQKLHLTMKTENLSTQTPNPQTPNIMARV